MSQTPAGRRQAILERLRAEGHVRSAELSYTMHVDSSTIRRDLERLERAGLIRRVHGGALPSDPSETVDTPWEVREAQRRDQKQAIGRAAAALVHDGQSVLLDNGSTTYQVATALSRHRHLTVVTNDIMVALALREQGVHQVHLTGGLLLDTVFTLVGPAATRTVESLHVDWAFLGAEGVDVEAGITNINGVEIPLKQAMVASARHVAVVADSSKIGRRALATVCPLDDVDLVLTDDDLEPQLRRGFGDRLRCVPLAQGPESPRQDGTPAED